MSISGRIDQWLEHDRRQGTVIVGIAGGSGAGKTTIGLASAAALSEYRVAYVQHDAYYRDPSHLSVEARTSFNFDHPSALETDLLVQHLLELAHGRSIRRPVYDFSTHCRKRQTETVTPGQVILVEGLFVLAEPSLRDLFHVKAYVDAQLEIRFARRLERDLSERGRTVESVKEQYLRTVSPMHEQYVEPSKRYADLILSGEAPLGVTVSLLTRAIRALIEGTRRD